jgi:3-hydroxyisobutyrate dehydrogenase
MTYLSEGNDTMKIAWIGVGRMGAPMAARLLKAGHPVSIWNRTRAKAKTAELKGATVVDDRAELADADALFTMLSTGKDVIDVCFGPEGMFRDGLKRMPKMLIDCSTIGMDQSAEIRARLDKLGVKFLAAPVSGNPKCVRAGKFCCVVSGPKAAYEAAKPLLLAIAPRGAAYAGEGELARMCKIAVNLMLAVVNMNMAEVTLLAQKAGVPRHAFLEFLNGSVVGSTFTKYKTPAFVNLDFTTTFPATGHRKDIDLGLALARELEVSMPVTAATREMLQAHIGANRLKSDAAAEVGRDFAAVFETMALLAGVKLEPENVEVSDGLDPEEPKTREPAHA